MYTVFEWDERKAEINRKKHGVSFQTATLAFTDPWALREIDQVRGGETRWQLIGRTADQVILAVAHTMVEASELGTEIEVIRIISARNAEPKEKRRYEQDGSLCH